MLKKWSYWFKYKSGDTPWDTNQTPPELVSLLDDLPPGSALDVGCGTGTNALFMAQLGWTVTGIDYIWQPIRKARRKAQKAGLTDRIDFKVGDVVNLDRLDLHPVYSLSVDIGCTHNFSRDLLGRYVYNLSGLLLRHGLALSFMFRPSAKHEIGFDPDFVVSVYEPYFDVSWVELTEDVSSGRLAAWYLFMRNGR